MRACMPLRPRPGLAAAGAGPPAAKARAVVDNGDDRVRGLQPGAHGQAARSRMLEDIGEHLLQDAQHVQRGRRRQPGHRRQRADPPVERQPGGLQARSEPKAQRGQQQGQVGLRGLERIDGKPQIVQAFLQHLRHRAFRAVAVLHHAQRRHQR
ncbi:hypothetical protein [Bordetella pertussis]|uniref:hypothetical protein n=1 Tax=Bordetella pertussis TaxID=520 RepID=UPI001F390CB1|nr:hypothetical protein [Bordetella pertussis]